MRDPKPVLVTLVSRGLLRMRETEEGYRVARPEGEANKSVCVLTPQGKWRDVNLGTTGWGLVSLARHLDIGWGIFDAF